MIEIEDQPTSRWQPHDVTHRLAGLPGTQICIKVSRILDNFMTHHRFFLVRDVCVEGDGVTHVQQQHVAPSSEPAVSSSNASRDISESDPIIMALQSASKIKHVSSTVQGTVMAASSDAISHEQLQQMTPSERQKRAADKRNAFLQLQQVERMAAAASSPQFKPALMPSPRRNRDKMQPNMEPIAVSPPQPHDVLSSPLLNLRTPSGQIQDTSHLVDVLVKTSPAVAQLQICSPQPHLSSMSPKSPLAAFKSPYNRCVSRSPTTTPRTAMRIMATPRRYVISTVYAIYNVYET